MWRLAITTLTLVTASRGFVLHSFSVPSSAEPGSTVHLEAKYELGKGEHIERLRWSKDNKIIMTYSQQPEEITWGDSSGINVDRSASRPSRLVLRNVGDSASGQYTLALLVSSSDGNVASFVNSNSMTVGAGGIGNRFGGSAGAAGGGGQSFQSSSSSASSSGPGAAGGTFQSSFAGGSVPGGAQTSFQSSSAGTFFGSAFGGAQFPFDSNAFVPPLDNRGGFAAAGAAGAAGGPQSLDAALQNAHENIRRAQAQLSFIQQALDNLARGY